MKAICVTPNRDLELRDVPMAAEPAPGHLLIDMDAAAINHGDRTFLKMPASTGIALTLGQYDVWGASGAGRVVAVGAGVPPAYAGKQVAAYRSLARSPESVGLWCEQAQVPYSACVVLPDHVSARDYCGSLVNVMTAYAYLDEIADAGHTGVIVTAGSSATGYALASLARSRNVRAIFLVRTVAAQKALQDAGAEHVLVTDDSLADKLGPLSARLQTTAVFDGVGGTLLSRVLPCLPLNSTIHCYGFLAGAEPLSIPSSILFMTKNLTIKRFSNFESRTVRDRERLDRALKVLEGLVDDPMFATKLGRTFRMEQVDDAMAYQSIDGDKAILLLS